MKEEACTEIKACNAERAEEQQKIRQSNIPQNLGKVKPIENPDKEIAKAAGVSHDTIAKVEYRE